MVELVDTAGLELAASQAWGFDSLQGHQPKVINYVMPSNPRRGTSQYKAQERKNPSQEALIKQHAAKAKATPNKFEAAVHAEAAKATARLDNVVRRSRRGTAYEK